jgi:tRNA pseudouridine38-40 synthase
MRRIKLIISFDGTGYFGWQRQKELPTIQAEIERILARICNHRIVVNGAGRTDAGVHALGMCAHFQTISTISINRLQAGCNSLLPAQIRITDACEVAPDFHARFSALAKTYRYTLSTGAVQCPLTRLYQVHYPYHLNPQAMRHCLAMIEGTHDFTSFETSGTRDIHYTSGKGPFRTIYAARLMIEPAETYHFIFTGDGFLKQMVRNLMGTIRDVGRGKKTVEEFAAIMAATERGAGGPTAPAHGLTLMTVHYED